MSRLFISLRGRTGVESAQWVSVRGPLGPGIWLDLPTAYDSLWLLWSISQGSGAVEPFLDSALQD